MLNYENLVNSLIRLQNCLKLSGIVKGDIVSKLDFLTKPRAGIALSVSIWANQSFRDGLLSYSDLLYVQRRLIQFLSKFSKSELEFLTKLPLIMPQRYGLELRLISSRCMVEPSLLTMVFQAINFLQECIDYLKQGVRVSEPIRKEPRVCMNLPELLPPAKPSVDVYAQLIIESLISDEDVAKDPVLNNTVEVINEKYVRGSLNECDVAAISLIALIITRKLRNTVICAEPCVNVEAYAKRLYNDLTYLGADPERSEIYELYAQLLSKSTLL